MKPIIKFNTLVLSLTTTAVFGIWMFISRLILAYPEWFKDQTNNKYNLLGLLLLGLISVGVYRLFFLVTSYLVNNCHWIKRLVFSSDYLEGTWIGFYIGVSGNVRYIIETYEQTIDNLTIRGTSYDENKNLHTFWTSESYNINAKDGEITYQYKVRSTKENTDPNGIAYFSFIRDNNKKAPEFIVGYSVDSHLSMKCKAMEKKLSKSTAYEINNTLDQAVLFYEEHKSHVFNYKKKVS